MKKGEMMIPEHLIPLTIILCYLALLLMVGTLANRLFTGGKTDYLLASHSIGPFLLLMSLFGTTMTAFALVGSSGESFKEGIGVYGMLASSSGILHSLCFFLIGVKIWRFGNRYGYTTQIEFFRDRLESRRFGVLLFPILVGLVIPYLLIGVIGGGVVMQSMTAGSFPDLFPTSSPATSGGLPKWLGSGLICGVVLIYVFFGGMRGTAWANAFQTTIFMVLGLVAFLVIASKLGGKASLYENLIVCSEALDFDKATREGMSKTKFLTYMLIPLSVGMFPHIFQHWLTAKSANSFKLPVVVHPLFIMIVWLPCVLIGAWASSALLVDPASLPKIPGTEIPNANAILPFLVSTQAGPVLGGCLTAGILAAIMSSLDSQFLCLGTMFTEDVLLPMGGEGRFSDKQQVWAARGFIIGIVLVTYLIAQLNPTSVFALGVWCFSGFTGLIPLVLAALYWRRLTKWGGYASVLATILSWAYLFYQSGFGKDRGFTVNIPVGGETYETMAVLWVTLASSLALVGISLVTRPPSETTIRRFFGARKAESPSIVG